MVLMLNGYQEGFDVEGSSTGSEEIGKYLNGETWPATTPCTVTGADDALVPDSATSSSAMTRVTRWLPT